MATKKFKDYAIAGNNVTLTYDDINDTVSFDVNVDKNDVGLGNVDNTSDANKPISTATQSALDLKASTTALNAHTSDLNNPHAVTKAQVGLANVDNTSDLNKPISTATQNALNGKQDSLGFTAENVANKSISVTTDQASNTKYPSVKSVYDWGIGAFQPILGFTPVTNARTLTINGTTYDLSANRTWSVGDLLSSGSYSNPTWLTALAWGKITGTPTTLSGYGITDAVPSSRTLTINGTSYDLSADRTWTISTATPTLAQVTTAGNTTTNAISVGGLTAIYSDNAFNQGVTIKNTNTGTQALVGVLLQNSSGTGVGQFTYVPTNYIDSTLQNTVIFSSYALQKLAFIANATNTGTGGSDIYFKTRASNTNGIILFGNSQNVGINTTTDAGYKLDVNGTARFIGELFSGNYIGSQISRIKLKAINPTPNTAYFIMGEGRLDSTNLFYIREDGRAYFPYTITPTLQVDIISQTSNASGITLAPYNALDCNVGIQNGVEYTFTNGERSTFKIGQGYNPASGTGIYNTFLIRNTINQTGGANGITRGIYINPTLTSAVDYRAIDVAGGKIVSTASITASSALAQGVYFNNTLVAAANNDVLVGLDINPTFTNGAFTGVSNIGLRVSNALILNAGSITSTNNTQSVGVFGGSNFNNGSYFAVFGNNFGSSNGVQKGSIQIYTDRSTSETNGGTFQVGSHNAGSSFLYYIIAFKNGNIWLGNNNAGSFPTDAGYKLDVNGSTRLNGALTLGMTPIAAASVVSTHKLQITIAGTTYYLLASNV